MSHRDVPVPACVRATCRFDPRGFPITYVTFVRPDTGEPDFRIVDQAKARACMNRRWCGICGLGLGASFVLIGGDEAVDQRMFSDPAMHEECGRYALAVCPFLASPRGHHRPVAPDARTGESLLIDNPLAGAVRPDRIALYFATGYEVIGVAAHEGAPVVPAILAGPPTAVEWFA